MTKIGRFSDVRIGESALRQLKKLRAKMRYAFYFLTNVKPTYKSKFLNRHKGRFLLRFLTCVSGHSWLYQNYEICVLFDFEIYQRPNSRKNAKNSIQAIFRNFTAMHNLSYDPLMTRRFR